MDWTADKKSPNSLNAIAPLEHINCFNGFALQKLIELCGLKRVYPNEYPKCEILNEPPHIPYPTQRIKIALKDIARPFWRKLFPLKAKSRENQDTDIIVVPK